ASEWTYVTRKPHDSQYAAGELHLYPASYHENGEGGDVDGQGVVGQISAYAGDATSLWNWGLSEY
ncbi:MAG: hypothetical protein AB1726_18350, partial [Planctomycetota bacterium]